MRNTESLTREGRVKVPGTKTPIRYYLLRHGETEYARDSRYGGWSNSPLTESGFRQHQKKVERLSTVTLWAIYTSDLARCTWLAQELGSCHNLSPKILQDLRELDFGEFDGKTYGDVLHEHPEALARWLENPLESSPPGGETLLAFQKRLLRAMQNIQSQVGSIPQDTPLPISIAIVTHGGVIRTLLCQWLEIPIERQWQFKIDPGSIAIIEEYDEGAICCAVNI